MIVLTEENVAEYTDRFLPEEYKPGVGKLIFAISPVSPEMLALLISVIKRKPIEDFLDNKKIILCGFCVNTSMLFGQKEPKVFDIFLKQEYESEEELAFVMLHEVGHVDFWVNEGRQKSFEKEGSEFYADFYAFERMVDIMGVEKALDALCHYASKDGFAKKESKP